MDWKKEEEDNSLDFLQANWQHNSIPVKSHFHAGLICCLIRAILTLVLVQKTLRAKQRVGRSIGLVPSRSLFIGRLCQCSFAASWLLHMAHSVLNSHRFVIYCGCQQSWTIDSKVCADCLLSLWYFSATDSFHSWLKAQVLWMCFCGGSFSLCGNTAVNIRECLKILSNGVSSRVEQKTTCAACIHPSINRCLVQWEAGMHPTYGTQHTTHTLIPPRWEM